MEHIRKHTGFDARLTILGHMQRGGPPTARSRVLASRFGARAVELLLEGVESNMVGIQNGEIVSVNLDYVAETSKELDASLYHLAEVLSS